MSIPNKVKVSFYTDLDKTYASREELYIHYIKQYEESINYIPEEHLTEKMRLLHEVCWEL